MVFNQYETWLIRGVCWDCILAVACISFMLEHCSREIDARRHFLQRFSTLCLWREIAPSRPEQGSREQRNKLLRSSELLWSSQSYRKLIKMQIIIELRLGCAAPARGGRRDSSVHLVIAKPQFAFQMRKSPMSFFLDTMAQNFTLARAAARPFEHSWLPKTKDFCLESFQTFVKTRGF